MRSQSLAVLAAAVLLSCSGEKTEPAPPLVRVDVTPDFGKIEREDPEASLPSWKRTHGVVLGDLRSAHALRSGTEFSLALPAGAHRIATAFSARRIAGTGKDGDAQITFLVGKPRHWKVLETLRSPLSQLLCRWVEIEMSVESGISSDDRLLVRAEVSGAADPQSIELVVEPPRVVGKRTDERWNVLVLSIDTLRADHLSCYGYARPTSPRIDALAREGVLFEQVVSAAPWTLPSYGSLFTSCTPAVHRAGVNTTREERFGTDVETPKEELEILRADLPTLAERLSAAGWATAGFQANSFLRAKNGVDRGFSRWVFYQYHADFGIELALDWIGKHASTPWFCFLHVMDVHQPYAPPPPFDRKFSERSYLDVADYPPAIESLREKPPEESMRKLLVDEYDGTIAATDDQIGRMLDRLKELGELDRTLVVVHSDHGEEFWEHGGYEHGHTEHEELLHVPLILWRPGKLSANLRVVPRVRLIDVMPTLLEFVGLEVPGGIEGKSLLPLVEGKTEPLRDCISEATLHGTREIKAIAVGGERLCYRGAGPGSLFDLVADSGELADLRADRTARAKELEERLLRRHGIILQSALRATSMQLSAAERKRLRDLGYVDGGDPH